MKIRIAKPFRLYAGDCLQVMPTLAAGSVDLILTDPPYGTTANKWDEVIDFSALWQEYRRILKPAGIVVLFSAQPFTSLLVVSNLSWFKYDLVWKKSNTTGHLNAKKMPLRQHETLCVFSPAKLGTSCYNPEMTVKGKPIKKGNPLYVGNNCYGSEKNRVAYLSNKYYPTSVLEIGGTAGNRGLHPNEKPTAILENLIRTYSNAGEMVLDSCMGSGSTGVAAANTGRRFIGIEKEERYYDIARERVRSAYDNQKA